MTCERDGSSRKEKNSNSERTKKTKISRQLTIDECLSMNKAQNITAMPQETNQESANELFQNLTTTEFKTPSDIAGTACNLEAVQQIQPGNQGTNNREQDGAAANAAQPTKEKIVEEARARAFRARSPALIFRKFAASYPDLIYNFKITQQMEDVLRAVTNILTWRGANSTVLQLVWTAFEQIKRWTGKSIRVIWLKATKENPMSPMYSRREPRATPRTELSRLRSK